MSPGPRTPLRQTSLRGLGVFLFLFFLIIQHFLIKLCKYLWGGTRLKLFCDQLTASEEWAQACLGLEERGLMETEEANFW